MTFPVMSLVVSNVRVVFGVIQLTRQNWHILSSHVAKNLLQNLLFSHNGLNATSILNDVSIRQSELKIIFIQFKECSTNCYNLKMDYFKEKKNNNSLPFLFNGILFDDMLFAFKVSNPLNWFVL